MKSDTCARSIACSICRGSHGESSANEGAERDLGKATGDCGVMGRTSTRSLSALNCTRFLEMGLMTGGGDGGGIGEVGGGGEASREEEDSFLQTPEECGGAEGVQVSVETLTSS